MPQWVGLVDDKSEKDHGVQGFLQTSVVVLGPGDKQRAHDGSEKDTDGVDAGPPQGGATEDSMTLQSLVLMPPSVQQDMHFLVITLHQVCDVAVCTDRVDGCYR